MTKDTEEFSQFTDAVACREYTMPREEEASEPKGWIRGHTKIGPVLEVATCCLHGKYGVEIRIMSMNKDNFHSWVRISHGSSKLVKNLNNSEQETSEVQLEEYALKLNASDFACRSKAKAKPQRREPAGPSTRTIPIGERTWTDVEPGEYSIFEYAVSKKCVHLLRHGSLPRENEGAIEFWRIKDYLQKYFPHCPHWSDNKWKKNMARGGGNKKRYQYCTDSSGVILYLRALQGHSGRNLIDPTLQDNVVIPDDFFQYIYHVGSAINLHSIINSGLILGGQQSGLNEIWWVDSMECYTYLRNVTDLLSDGKTPSERRCGQPFKGPIILCGSLVECHPITATDQSRIHQFGKKVFPGLFLGYALYAGRIWKGDVLIADLEELETMDASEIYSKRLNAKEVIFPKQGEFIFPIADGRIKHPWRRSGTENIHLDTAATNSRRKSH